MSMELVNGYVCRDCTDVERARKGEDPAKPVRSGSKADATGGTVASKDEEPFGVNRPLTGGDRGTQVNLLA